MAPSSASTCERAHSAISAPVRNAAARLQAHTTPAPPPPPSFDATQLRKRPRPPASANEPAAPPSPHSQRCRPFAGTHASAMPPPPSPPSLATPQLACKHTTPAAALARSGAAALRNRGLVPQHLRTSPQRRRRPRSQCRSPAMTSPVCRHTRRPQGRRLRRSQSRPSSARTRPSTSTHDAYAAAAALVRSDAAPQSRPRPPALANESAAPSPPSFAMPQLRNNVPVRTHTQRPQRRRRPARNDAPPPSQRRTAPQPCLYCAHGYVPSVQGTARRPAPPLPVLPRRKSSRIRSPRSHANAARLAAPRDRDRPLVRSPTPCASTSPTRQVPAVARHAPGERRTSGGAGLPALVRRSADSGPSGEAPQVGPIADIAAPARSPPPSCTRRRRKSGADAVPQSVSQARSPPRKSPRRNSARLLAPSKSREGRAELQDAPERLWTKNFSARRARLRRPLSNPRPNPHRKSVRDSWRARSLPPCCATSRGSAYPRECLGRAVASHDSRAARATPPANPQAGLSARLRIRRATRRPADGIEAPHALGCAKPASRAARTSSAIDCRATHNKSPAQVRPPARDQSPPRGHGRMPESHPPTQLRTACSTARMRKRRRRVGNRSAEAARK
ncbi:hypothetical protein B0H15DRAFT_972028 [Mycena belliarum]|uniref:Uncharacterized protein n=1 Tax=Mycena belliarum TaxID=1033014 RepID=A0AAD6XHM6_9AGAR|nr:hypothetical protein B0H15DRAFT_972028 [Mycena belliae]